MQQVRKDTTTTVQQQGDAGSNSFVRAKRTPIKHSIALRKTCIDHGVAIDDANLVVCQGRKVVFVLRVGDIHSASCFFKEAPTPSFKKSSGIPDSGWQWVVVPNGWKVAVIVDNDVWTAEIAYAKENDVPHYQFTRLDDKGHVLVRSDWQLTPSGAFKAASTDYFGDDSIWGRHNGKLYVGCTYDYPQVFLRRYFKRKLEEAGSETTIWTPAVLKLMKDWLDPSKQSPRAMMNIANGVGPETYTRDPVSFDPLSDNNNSNVASSSGDAGSSGGDVSATSMQADGASSANETDTGSAASFDPKRVKLGADGFSTAKGPVQRRAPRAGPPPEPDSATIRLENAIRNWLAMVSPEITAETYSSEMKLRSMFPGVPVYPTNSTTQTKVLSSPQDTPLNEEELTSILFRADGHIQRAAVEKSSGHPPESGPVPQTRKAPVVGYITAGAVKKVIEAALGGSFNGGGALVTLGLFLETLESIEKTAESLFPLLVQTLVLFSVDDIMKRFQESRADIPKSSILFIRNRMKELNVETSEDLKRFSNPSEFMRVMTFLPKAHFVREFVATLRAITPQMTTPAASTSASLQDAFLLGARTGGSASSATPVGFASSKVNGVPFFAQPHGPLPQLGFLTQPLLGGGGPWLQLRPGSNLMGVPMFINMPSASANNAWMPMSSVDPSVAAAAAAIASFPSWLLNKNGGNATSGASGDAKPAQ